MALFYITLLVTLATGYQTLMLINTNSTNTTSPDTTTLDTSTEENHHINIHLNKTQSDYRDHFISIAKTGQVSPNRILNPTLK